MSLWIKCATLVAGADGARMEQNAHAPSDPPTVLRDRVLQSIVLLSTHSDVEEMLAEIQRHESVEMPNANRLLLHCYDTILQNMEGDSNAKPKSFGSDDGEREFDSYLREYIELNRVECKKWITKVDLSCVINDQKSAEQITQQLIDRVKELRQAKESEDHSEHGAGIPDKDNFSINFEKIFKAVMRALDPGQTKFFKFSI